MKFRVQVQDKTSLLVDLKPALTLDMPFWFKTQLFAPRDKIFVLNCKLGETYHKNRSGLGVSKKKSNMTVQSKLCPGYYYSVSKIYLD